MFTTSTASRTTTGVENLQLMDHGGHAALSNSSRAYSGGYKLRLTDKARAARSAAAKSRRLWEFGHKALAKAQALLEEVEK
jgi:hypothetical protein